MIKKMKVLPDSIPGKGSVLSVVVFFIFVAILNLVFDVQNASWSGSSSNALAEDVFAIGAVFMSTIGMLMGLVAIFKHKDYSIVVGLATILGIVVLLLQD
ncbi:MAG: hypothetical protein GT601_18625 [Acidaminobacter sp.]|uniref:hypothetical protein n=1 Tax=Acidaminobacter sp. TaxID=1872102 RepID=UPI00137E5957|nr:hypothetical protein [Acidaminobacter sp.]MZQ99686.1 hypothetical protein [Acidaminobacter sp.]